MATKAIVIGLGGPILELDSEEVTKTKGGRRVSNSIRGQGNTALYETTDKRIKLGSLQVDPRPYLYYGVSKGSIVQETIGVRVRGENNSKYCDNNRGPYNRRVGVISATMRPVRVTETITVGL